MWVLILSCMITPSMTQESQNSLKRHLHYRRKHRSQFQNSAIQIVLEQILQ